MAEKSKTSIPPKTPPQATPAKSAGAAAPQVPALQTRNLAVLGAAVLLLWAMAAASRSVTALVVMGVLTVALAAGGVWVWRLIDRQKKLATLMQRAQSGAAGRDEVLKQLSADGAADQDVMNVVIRAQLEAQEDPEKALDTLDTIDMKKVPGLMVDEVQGMRAQMLLVVGRTREAGEIADKIKVSQSQQADSRGMLAATVAEAWARSGRSKEAAEMLVTYSPDDESYVKLRVPLLFARIFANFAESRKELVRKDMLALIKDDPNYLGRFVHPKWRVHPELAKMARDLLMRDPEVRKQAQKMGRAQQGHPRRFGR